MSAARVRARFAAATLALLGSVAAPAVCAQTPTPRENAARILRERQYAFCHDAARIVRPGERPWCEFVDARSACPEFAQACRREPPRPPSCQRQRPSTVQGARTVLLTLLAVATGVLLGLLLRSVLRARRAERLVDKAAVEAERPSAVPIPHATAAELLARALEAYEHGDYGQALYRIYAALLRRLDERGVIRIDPARTNGDYVRQCEPAELRAPLRDTVREVERVRFGGATPSREVFERLRGAVEPIVRSSAALLVVWALLGATLAGCGDMSGQGGRAESGPAGHRAVRALLQAEGLPTHVLTDSPEDVRDVGRVLVIDGVAAELSADQWRTVLDWVQRGGAVILAGGSAHWPAALGVDTTVDPRAGTSVVLAQTFGGLPIELPAAHPMLTHRSTGYTVASAPATDGPYAMLVSRGSGRILVLASHELVTNGGLAVGENAAALVALTRHFAQGRELYFVEDPEAGDSNPLRSLMRAGVLPAVLQALLLLGLFYVMVGRHFATPRGPRAADRRAFAEHVRAIGAMYARARASRHVLRAYGTLALERARERTQVGAATGHVVEALAARVGEPREDVERALAALEQARTGADAANEAGDLRLVKRLNDWMRKLS